MSDLCAVTNVVILSEVSRQKQYRKIHNQLHHARKKLALLECALIGAKQKIADNILDRKTMQKYQGYMAAWHKQKIDADKLCADLLLRSANLEEKGALL